MGYILTPIAVDLGRVADAIGSKDERLLSALVNEFGDEFADIDEIAARHADDEAGGEALTVRDALSQMVRGEEYVAELGFVYGYALEFICRYFGEFLPNRKWWAMPSGSYWARKVDEELEAAGIPEKAFRVVNHLMFRGAPIAIPEIDDFPGIGYLMLNEITAAQKALGEANLMAINGKEVRDSVQELQGWLQRCVDSNRDLICFYA